MSEFDPVPDSETSQPRWQEGTDTFGRVYECRSWNYVAGCVH